MKKGTLHRISLFILTHLCVMLILYIPFIVHGQSSGVDDPDRSTSASWGPDISAWIGNLIVSMAAIVTWMGGKFLDTSMEWLVLGMGDLFVSQGIGIAVNKAWVLMRDVSNLAFIFGFAYIGIRTIIEGVSGTTKRMVVALIIGALLINFSLFIVKFVTDVTNILAIEIHEAFVPDGTSISEAFANQLGMVSIFTLPEGEKFANMTATGEFTHFLMLGIFLLIAGFVFAAGGFLLIIRFVALLIIMVFSPILFVASIFPQTEQYASMLWSKLISYAFFAPAYLFLLFISFKLTEPIAQSLGIAPGDTMAGAMMNVGAFEVFINYMIIIFFLIASLLIAQKLGVYGGNQVVAYGRKARALLGTTAGVATGWAGRKYIGERAEQYKKDLDRREAEDGTRRRFRKSLADRALNAKFGGQYSRADDKKYDDDIKRRAAGLKQVKRLEEAVARDKVNEADVKDMTLNQLETAGFDKLNRKDVVGNLSNARFAELMKSEKLDEKEKQQLAEKRSEFMKEYFTENGKIVTTELANASIAQLEAVGEEFIAKNAATLTETQLKDLDKSKVYTEEQMKRIKEARRKKQQELLGTDPAALFNTTNRDGTTKRKSAREIAKMAPEVLMDDRAAKHLSVGVLDEIFNQKSMNIEERNKLVEVLKNNRANVPDEVFDYLNSPEVQKNWVIKNTSDDYDPVD